MAKRRLDLLLVERELAATRHKAQALVMAGLVLVGEQIAAKPGTLVDEDAPLRLRGRPPYVSRGGEKLDYALAYFRLDVRELVAADIGAGTGGFTDCLLQRGACRVYAIDVGYGQLDYRLRQDPRVVAMERVNARHLETLPQLVDLATVDVSFISLEKVLPAVARLLRSGGQIVALFKPQFQARRGEVGRGGVVREPALHAAVMGRFAGWAVRHGFRMLGLTPSPLLGPAGNREFFLLLRPEGEAAGARAPLERDDVE
ncbi:MAG: TlyA family RNA methyltransferase [Dehalococcoidia bacterium]